MAKPADIENGQKPDATKLMTWLNWLSAGKGVASGASAAKGTPEDYQLYWATDAKQLFFYTKDSTLGANGWIIIG